MTRRQQNVNLSAWDNGSGISVDIDILAEALQSFGCRVWVNGGARRRGRRGVARIAAGLNRRLRIAVGRRYDANIFLESIDPKAVRRARVNCLIPNPEWLHDATLPHVARMDWVLCKTRGALDALRALTPRVRYLGFTSPDRRFPGADRPRELRCLHAAGQSQSKGTAAVVEAWRRHPEWPQLVLIRRQHASLPPMAVLPPLPNVLYLNERVDDAAARRFQNDCAVHLCPSEAEGFGHYIVEAMSCGAVAVTTDAPPMNELVAPDRGVLASYASSKRMRLATSYAVDVDDLERQIARAVAMTPAERTAMGARAREWYEASRAAFTEAVGRFVEELAESGLPGRA